MSKHPQSTPQGGDDDDDNDNDDDNDDGCSRSPMAFVLLTAHFMVHRRHRQ